MTLCTASLAPVTIVKERIRSQHWYSAWWTIVWVDLHKVHVGRSYSSASAIQLHPDTYSDVACKTIFSQMTIPKSQFHFSSHTVHFWSILDEQTIGCHRCRPVTYQLVDSMRQTNGPLTERIKCCLKSCSNSILCQKRKIIISGPFSF